LGDEVHTSLRFAARQNPHVAPLRNGDFDKAPFGMDWTEQPIRAGDELVVGIDAADIPPHSLPNKLWLGGYERAANTDAVYQNVPVPSGATTLVLTGQYQIATGEFSPNTNYDTGKVELVTTTNTSIELALSVGNTNATSTWTPFMKVFSTAHAGETVRVRLTTSGDSTNFTSFFFDSLSLKATVKPSGCP
jgi:hypothetical protein